ncbi:leucine-rich repeat isoform f [Anaeramoeba flamelloides]|uniref:Leucine-rich repeat isoform f n=1 Tax=Anaeramoeba flamelloides TaxID=1746091 RepID=A0AAV7Y6C8_9EUKA|nr:leucine-rich repeat isoform f [Anaeramoeba flamelloides]
MSGISKKERKYIKKQKKLEAKILKKQLAEEKKTTKLLKKQQKKQQKKHRKRQRKTKKIDFTELPKLTIEERTHIEGIVESAGEQALLAENILKKKSFKKIEHRVLVLTKYRIITIGKRKKSLKKKICRNGHLFNLKKIEFFDDTHFKIHFKDFLIDIYRPNAIDFLDQIRENYFKIVIGLPEEKLCKFEDYSIIISDSSSEDNDGNLNLSFRTSIKIENINNDSSNINLDNSEESDQENFLKSKNTKKMGISLSIENGNENGNENENGNGNGNGNENENESENEDENENGNENEFDYENENNSSSSKSLTEKAMGMKIEIEKGNKNDKSGVVNENRLVIESKSDQAIKNKIQIKKEKLKKIKSKYEDQNKPKKSLTKTGKKNSTNDMYLSPKHIRLPNEKKNPNKTEDMVRTKSVDTISDIQRANSLWGFEYMNNKSYPGNGFIKGYKAWCSYYKTPISKAFIQFVKDGCFGNKNKKKKRILDLSNFKRIDLYMDNSVDIYPIISALKYNDYFREIKLTNVYRKDPIMLIGDVLETNYSIERINLSGLESNEGFARLGQAMRINQNCQLTYLDLSGNKIQKKESKKFSNGLSSLIELETLNLGFCGLIDSSLSNVIVNLLTLNKLEYLNLSGNKFGSKSSSVLSHLLSINKKKMRKRTLQVLMLDFSSVSLKTISASLFHSQLQYLSIVGNNFSKEDTWCLSELLKEIQHLKHLDVSSCNLNKQYFVLILDSILNNKNLFDFRLGASNIHLGPEIGKKILEVFETNSDSMVLKELILDNNELGALGIKHLFEAAMHLKSLKKLSISRNILKGKAIEQLKESLLKVFTKSSITHLRCKGNEKYFLGRSFPALLNENIEMKSFQLLDFSKNNFQTDGLSMINDLLSNNLLKANCLLIDGNGSTLSTLENFIKAIENNVSLTSGTLPEKDISQIIEHSDKRSKKSVKKHILKYRNSFNKKLSKNRKKLNIKLDGGFMISADGIESMGQKELLLYINSLFFKHISDFSGV